MHFILEFDLWEYKNESFELTWKYLLIIYPKLTNKVFIIDKYTYVIMYKYL